VIVDATTLTVGVPGRGVRFRFEDVLEVDVKVDEEFIAVEEEVEEDVREAVPLEETEIAAVLAGVEEVEVMDEEA